MDEKKILEKNKNVPNETAKEKNISLEAAQELLVAVMERQVRRLFILCIVIFAALVISNAAWIYYENSFVDTITVKQDTPNGNNNYVGRDGSIVNGKSDNN